ncbi:glycosyltransferase family 39 protein [Chloroflexota bacterium]
MAHKLAVLIVLAVILRVGMLAVFPTVFAFADTGAIHGSGAFDEYAQNLRATGVYGREAGTPDAAIPPLYSYALAGVYGLAGRGGWAVGLFHTLLDVLNIVMLYAIGQRLFRQSEWIGWLAGLFYAFYPYLIFQNLTLIDTPFFMTLLFAFLLLMILLRDRAELDRYTLLLAVAGGAVFGLGVLTRPITPLLAMLIAVWFLFRLSFKQTVIRLLPVAVVGMLFVLPWIARNYRVFDAFIPMTTTSGPNFWQGNSQYTVPYLRAGYDVQWTTPKDDPNEELANEVFFELAYAYWAEDPCNLPELLWVKFLVHWSIDIAPRLNPTAGELPRLDYLGNALVETGADGGLNLTGVPEGDPVDVYSQPLFDRMGRTVHRYYYGTLFVLSLIGIVLTLSQWREVLLLWFVQLWSTAIYVFFHPSTRYRVPTDPLLFLFAAYTLWALADWWLKRRAGLET